MRRPALVFAALAAVPLACADRDPAGPDPTAAGMSSAPIFDGANGGNPHFFFLPPLVKAPAYSGTFNPHLSPVVEICALAASGDACADPQPQGFPLRFTMGGAGNTAVRLNEEDEHYGVTWQTGEYALDPAVHYRVRVFPVGGGGELGHLDVDVVLRGGGRATSGTSASGLAIVQLGTTQPIHFRIEQGIGCMGTDDCTEVVVDESGGVVVVPSEFAGVAIPQGALDAPVLITIERVDVRIAPCLPILPIQAEGCYRYDTEPALSAVQTSGLDEFNVDVVVGVCLDPDVLALPEHHQYALHKYDPEQPELGVLQLPTALVDYLDCSDFAALAPPPVIGAVERLVRAGWDRVAFVARLLGPARAHAVNLGFGGLTKSFSNIGWARGLEFTLLAGADQTGLAGSSLPIDPSVLVTATHWEPEEFESAPSVPGVPVTFRFTDPAGAITEVVDTTDAEGVASVPWVLGPDAGTNTLQVIGATSGNVVVEAEGIVDLVEVARVADTPGTSDLPTYPTIAMAYGAVEPGGTILLAEGVHAVYEQAITKPVTIEAESAGEGEYVEAIVRLDTPPAECSGPNSCGWGFLVNGIEDGTVAFRGLQFQTSGFQFTILVRGQYDDVVVDASTFELNTAARAQGVVGGSLAASGRIQLTNSTFTGGLIGAQVFGDVFLEGNTFSGQSERSILAGDNSGRIASNAFSDCGSTCISAFRPESLEIADNAISITLTDNRTLAILVGSLGADRTVSVTGNQIVGTDDPADPTNPLAYPIIAAIQVSGNGTGVPSQPVIVTNNFIRNAHQGIAAYQGGVITGRDNRLEQVHQGLTSYSGATNAVRFSDFSGAFIGLNGDGSFAASCNWWGTANGPPNVPPHIVAASYSPWATESVAGTAATDCSGGPDVTAAFNEGVAAFALAFVGGNRSGTLGHFDNVATISGMLADEIVHTGTFPTRLEVDRRQVEPANGTVADLFSRLQRARALLAHASAALAAEFEQSDLMDARLPAALALEAYSSVALAETFCSGVPAAALGSEGELLFGPAQTTAQVLAAAIGRLDEALSAAQYLGTPDVQLLGLIHVGRARAYLGLDDPAAAAASAANVPSSFVYTVSPDVVVVPTYSLTNAFYSLNAAQRRISVAHGEGGNGIAFRNGDSRVSTALDPQIGFDGTSTVYDLLDQALAGTLAADAPFPLASGVEARLIEAEALLATGSTAAALNTVNALRAARGMAPFLTLDVDLLFEERAFWLYATGQRLGDLRRLVRQYDRNSEELFPTGVYPRGGAYGSDVNLPIPPVAGTCLDRSA